MLQEMKAYTNVVAVGVQLPRLHVVQLQSRLGSAEWRITKPLGCVRRRDLKTRFVGCSLQELGYKSSKYGSIGGTVSALLHLGSSNCCTAIRFVSKQKESSGWQLCSVKDGAFILRSGAHESCNGSSEEYDS